jgi:hypothetical protein
MPGASFAIHCLFAYYRVPMIIAISPIYGVWFAGWVGPSYDVRHPIIDVRKELNGTAHVCA